jgi:hypothetical protein
MMQPVSAKPAETFAASTIPEEEEDEVPEAPVEDETKEE